MSFQGNLSTSCQLMGAECPIFGPKNTLSNLISYTLSMLISQSNSVATKRSHFMNCSHITSSAYRVLISGKCLNCESQWSVFAEKKWFFVTWQEYVKCPCLRDHSYMGIWSCIEFLRCCNIGISTLTDLAIKKRGLKKVCGWPFLSVERYRGGVALKVAILAMFVKLQMPWSWKWIGIQMSLAGLLRLKLLRNVKWILSLYCSYILQTGPFMEP